MKKNVLIIIFALFVTNITIAQLFQQKSDFVEPRFAAISFRLNNALFAGTGFDSLYVMNNQMYKYDIASDSWTQINDFPTASLSNGITMVINDTAYAGFGWNGTGVSGWYQYHETSDTWLARNNTCNTGLASGTFTLNGKGYSVCGTVFPGGEQNELWQYDPAVNVWSQKSSFPGAARNNPFADTLGGFAYVGLGQNDNLSVAYGDIYRYDPINDVWTAIAPIPNSSTGVVAEGGCFFHASWNGKIILMAIGAIIPTAPADYNTIYIYDPITDSWILYENTNTIGTRVASITAQAGSKAYYGTGIDVVTSAASQEFYELDLNALVTSVESVNPFLKNISVYSSNLTICVTIPDEIMANGSIGMELYSMEGKIIKKFKLTGSDCLNVSSFVKGSYLYVIKSNNRILKSGKLIM